MTITLRPLADEDLDKLFVWESDPRAVELAAFTRADPSDRTAFDDHKARIRANPENTVLAIDEDGEFVGTIGSYSMAGDREVTYWIAPARWGEGIASRALAAFLDHEETRPLFGRTAEHNVGSANVLLRNGFVEIGEDTGFAPGIGREVVERIFRLDA
jgi:RimJ/RimL family protein N-acetyltransferase